MSYFFRYKSFTFEIVPGDTKFTLSSYLADEFGAPFLLSSGSLDIFSVVSHKSSLSGVDYKTFWTQLAQQAIASHYNLETTGVTSEMSNVIEGLESTENLVPGMLVVSNQFPEGTIINTVRDATSLIVSSQAVQTNSAATLYFSTASWFIDYTSLDKLITYVNFGNF